MAQIKNPLDEIRIPFQKMTFTPDVPSTALGPNEYNDGQNVETDVRGIRSMAGDQEILDTVPGIPTFVTGGFRQNNTFWFIVATYEIDPLDPTNPDANIGRWYASDGVTTWYDITPGGVPILGYRQNTNITEAWSGTIPLFNDTRTAPMFWPEPTVLDPNPIMTQYSNLILPADISTITYVDPVTQQITLTTAYLTAPYVAGQQIVISDVNNFFNGVFTVVSSTTTTIDYLAVPGGGYPGGPLGVVSPAYTWNYNPNWSKVIANFMRIYSTPNVGSILVAGDLTVTLTDGVTVERYPTTVQWSQAFGLNQAPRTWQPTVVNVANQLEVPLRGEALDAFPCNGQFFLCSYWDTVVFSPINYSTTSAPILGVRQFNQGRGLLSSNCWANTDKLVYGIDARDIWVFDGQDFQGLGNQRVKNWFYDQLDPAYYDRVFMEVNSQRSQVEIYYPDMDSVDGVPNKMLSYRYDLDCWNSPRDVSSATFSCESPIWEVVTVNTYAGPYNNVTITDPTPIYGAGGDLFDVTVDLTTGLYNTPTIVNGGYNFYSFFGYVGQTTVITGDQLGGTTPANDLTLVITSVDDGLGGAISGVALVGDGGTPVITTVSTNTPLLSSRTVVYARGVLDGKLVQKDQGYEFLDGAPIDSLFRRDNIKLLKDYSGKLMVHRILPEVVNIGAIHNQNNEIPIYPALGNITVTIEGANSVGSIPTQKTPVTLAVDANGNNGANPWAQINQNSFRVNSIELSNSSNAHIWMCSATTWQVTQVEDDR
jgi:hypothetical protein